MTNAVAEAVGETDTFDMGYITFFPQNGASTNEEGTKTNAWIASEPAHHSQSSTQKNNE